MVAVFLTSSPAKYTVKTIVKFNKLCTKLTIEDLGVTWLFRADLLTALCNTVDYGTFEHADI